MFLSRPQVPGKPPTIVFLPVDGDDHLSLVDVFIMGATVANPVENVVALLKVLPMPPKRPAQVPSVVDLGDGAVLRAFAV